MMSRRALATALALVLAPGLGAGPPSKTPVPDLRTRTSGEDWPTFLGPRQDARSTETGLLRTWPEAGPPLVWHVEAGEGYSAPSTSLGRLFFFDRVGDQARLRALHSETGRELWRRSWPSDYEDLFQYSNGPRAAPVIDGERAYVYGADGWLRALRVSDGELLWEVDTFARFGVVQNFFGVASTPVVEGESLIVAVGGTARGDWDIHSARVESNGTALVAFDRQTGRVRWTSGQELASFSSPLVRSFHGQRRGLYFARGGLLLFEPGSGEILSTFPWRARQVYSVNAATPVVAGDLVFLTESYEVGGIALRMTGTGFEELWRDPPRRGQSLAAHWSTPAWDRGFLYGSSGEKSGAAELRCVELESGRVRWSQPGLGRATVLWADGRLLVLTEYGRLLQIEATPEAYREAASIELEGEVGGRRRPLLRYPAWNTPVLSHGLLYLRGADRLVALEVIPEAAPRSRQRESRGPDR